MRDEIETYRSANVQPFGVNFAGVEGHRKYANKLKLPFPLLSNPEREVIAAYGALKAGEPQRDGGVRRSRDAGAGREPCIARLGWGCAEVAGIHYVSCTQGGRELRQPR